VCTVLPSAHEPCSEQDEPETIHLPVLRRSILSRALTPTASRAPLQEIETGQSASKHIHLSPFQSSVRNCQPGKLVAARNLGEALQVRCQESREIAPDPRQASQRALLNGGADRQKQEPCRGIRPPASGGALAVTLKLSIPNASASAIAWRKLKQVLLR